METNFQKMALEAVVKGLGITSQEAISLLSNQESSDNLFARGNICYAYLKGREMSFSAKVDSGKNLFGFCISTGKELFVIAKNFGTMNLLSDTKWKTIKNFVKSVSFNNQKADLPEDALFEDIRDNIKPQAEFNKMVSEVQTKGIVVDVWQGYVWGPGLGDSYARVFSLASGNKNFSSKVSTDSLDRVVLAFKFS